MKGKIDNDGSLFILRGKFEKDMECPNSFPSCGDWCPLFGEPEKTINEWFFKIGICHGKTLVFDELTDER